MLGPSKSPWSGLNGAKNGRTSPRIAPLLVSSSATSGLKPVEIDPTTPAVVGPKLIAVAPRFTEPTTNLAESGKRGCTRPEFARNAHGAGGMREVRPPVHPRSRSTKVPRKRRHASTCFVFAPCDGQVARAEAGITTTCPRCGFHSCGPHPKAACCSRGCPETPTERIKGWGCKGRHGVLRCRPSVVALQ